MVDAKDTVYLLSPDGDVCGLGWARWRAEWGAKRRGERSGDDDGCQCERGNEYGEYNE